MSVGSSDGILNDILNGRVALGSNTDPHLNDSEDRAQELQFLSPTSSETLTELSPKRLQRNSSCEISLASLAPDLLEQLPFDSSEAQLLAGTIPLSVTPATKLRLFNIV